MRSSRQKLQKTDHRRLNFESLENRQLLTASMCDPCDDLASPTEFTPPSVASATAQTSSFAPPEQIEIVGGIQSISGSTAQSNAALYEFQLAAETDIRVRRGSQGAVEFYLVGADEPLGGSAGIYSSRGELTATVPAGEYRLYVFDFLSRDRFDFELETPQRQPVFEEFADVPYLGRDFDWNLNLVNAPEVWAQGFTGEGALVAVVDTGVDYTHPDLDGNIWTNPGEIPGDRIDNDGNGFVDDVHGYDFAFRDNDPLDLNGHGTHVAGTIAAERNGRGTTGVAYHATILPVKVLRDDGFGSPFAIAQGIRYAVDVGADVINLSLGGGITRTVQNALQYALANDVLVVAASGNDAASRPGAPALFSSFLPNTLSVGAHDRFGNRSGFSNRVGNSRSVQIDAPGTNVASTYIGGGYRYLNGTSMAAPHVAGVAALTVSANPDITSVELRNLLTTGANQSVSGSDSIGGVNAAQTVARALFIDAIAAFDSTLTSSDDVLPMTEVQEVFLASVAIDSNVASAIPGIDLEDDVVSASAEQPHEEEAPNAITTVDSRIALIEAAFEDYDAFESERNCDHETPNVISAEICSNAHALRSFTDSVLLLPN